jgi:hypothetical protein
MNVQECAVFDTFFVPTKEFKEYLAQRGIDWGSLIKDEVSFDPEIIKYVKDNSDWHSCGRAKYAIRGMKTSLTKIGFFGTVTIIDVDIDRKWMIEYDSCDVPYPVYLDIEISAANYVKITKER